MGRFVALALLLLIAVAGCAAMTDVSLPTWPGGNPAYGNPVLLQVANHEFVWETVVDVVDDYFVVQHERPIRSVGAVFSDGELRTFPAIGSTIFEPWRNDSANRQSKIESTLQSIRRHAVIRVTRVNEGFWVDVAVFKELEDVIQPEHATAGAATLRYDSALDQDDPRREAAALNDGWIALGRDPALEQRIIGQLLARVGGRARPVGY